jgi:mono/diheme cytochrome c family protein
MAGPRTGYFIHLAACAVALATPLVAVGCSRAKPAPQPAPAQTQLPSPNPPQAIAAADRATDGEQLYLNYCAACHGETGDGNGPAARFLYPKPRNFCDAKFRLVSTTNRVPSDDDVMQVITHGMPGSGMFSFGHLSESDRKILIVYVRQLTRAGVEARLRKIAAEFGDELDPKQLAEDVELATNPGPTITISPHWPAADGDSVERGREVYVKQGCVSCHGEKGKGEGVQEQRDDDGTPTRPRDYTRGIFKGGRERKQLYARTLLGMPGSPMPSSGNLKHEQICDLVHFIQSLADPFAQSEFEHKRTRLVAQRSSTAISAEMPDTAWTNAPPIHIVVSPLWWRDYDEPALGVQALHDGQSLAIRLTWNDATRNERAVRPQDFEDQVAVQLFKGTREPFLGMGSTDGIVDLWVWNAGWQADLVEYADVDTQYPNMFVDEYQLEEKTTNGDDPRPHATTRQNKTFLAGFAAGNLRSDPARGLAGSANQAKGFGTLTLLPRPSQAVIAKGSWNDGRWSVVLRRPLTVSADAGLQLAAGDKLSIAFAIWDGAARDRDGQKLVSIWHDFELE